MQSEFSHLLELSSAEFLHAWILYALIPLALVFIISLFKNIRRGHVSFLRTLSLSLIILALANPVVKETFSSKTIVALYDASYSESDTLKKSFRETLARYLGDKEIKLFPFAGKVSKKSISIMNASDLDALSRVDVSGTNTGGTNLENAITEVLSLEQGAPVLLLSDGFETVGDILKKSEELKRKGVRVFPLIPPDAEKSLLELEISSLTAPLVVDAESKSVVSVAVKNPSGETKKSKLLLSLDSETIIENEIAIAGGTEEIIAVHTPPLSGGLKKITASLVSPDGSPVEQRHRWISSREKKKVLLLSHSKEDERTISRLLTDHGYAVDAHLGTEKTLSGDQLKNYSSVIINNTPKSELPSGFLFELKQLVEQGVGVLLIGGDKSFGLGDYIKTELEEISPVNFVPPQTTQKRLTNAVILVIDKSRSMVEENRILAAKRAALASIQTLKDDDLISVVGFDSTPFVIINLDTVANVKGVAEHRLRNLTAAGRTDLLPALSLAHGKLKNAQAGRKHIIVMTDGKLPGGGDAYFQQVASLKKDGISLSSVALGVEADVPLLKLLAQNGGGGFYHTLDPNDLAQVFIQDIKVTTGEKTLREKQEFPVLVSRAGARSTTLSRFPPLKGFVKTSPKDENNIELLTDDSEKHYPILASHLYGKGRVVAFTSDINGRWSAPWFSWDGFFTFWGEVFRSIKNQGEEKKKEFDFDVRFNLQGEKLKLQFASFDEDLLTRSVDVAASVTAPDGKESSISFTQEKKGLFSSEIEDVVAGDYKLKINYGGTSLPELATTIEASELGEKRGQGINAALLSELSWRTGGKVNPHPEDLRMNTVTTENRIYLSAPLLALAFLLLLVEAFIRERN